MATFRKRNSLWQAQVRSRKHGSISKSFHLKSDAQAWAREQESLMQTGQWSKEHNKATTLGDLLCTYKKLVTPNKRSHESELRRLTRLTNDPISLLRLNEVTPAEIATFRDRRLKDGNRTTEYDLVLLRHAWNIAVNEWDWKLPTNPVQKVRFPKPSPHRERRLRQGEYELLKTNCKERVWYLWPVIELAIETGMRRGELLSLEWKNIYLDSNRLVLNTTKNGKARIVPLTAIAKAVLKQINQDDDKVFPVTDVAVRQAWERLRASCEITDLTFHDLRHEAISRLFEKGLNVPEVASISGHKTPSQLFRYVQVKIP